MKRALVLAFMVISFTAGFAQKPTGKKDAPCKTEQNTEKCFWIHGRLAAYNGSPTFRVWRIGTKHIYGIYDNVPNFVESSEDTNFPPEVPICAFGNEVYADFEVCPLEPSKEGHMGRACIAAANNVVEKRFDDPPAWCQTQFRKHTPVVSKAASKK